jgi:hypothetical protein
MKKVEHFRAIMGTCMCVLLVMSFWWRAEWSTIQMCCLVIMFLAGVALLVNNQRNEAFHDAASIPMIAAAVVWFWTPTRNVGEGVVSFLGSIYFVWLAVKPYYIKWKKSNSPAADSNESLLAPEGNSKG